MHLRLSVLRSALLLLCILCSPFKGKALDLLFENNLPSISSQTIYWEMEIYPGEMSYFTGEVPVGESHLSGLGDVPLQPGDWIEIFGYADASLSPNSLITFGTATYQNWAIAEAAGEYLHISLTTGMSETQIGRAIMVNDTEFAAGFGEYVIAANSTNYFTIPEQPGHVFTIWGDVTRPWGWLSKVQWSQPYGENPGQMGYYLWLHENDPPQYTVWNWDEPLQEWVFGQIGFPGNDPSQPPIPPNAQYPEGGEPDPGEDPVAGGCCTNIVNVVVDAPIIIVTNVIDVASLNQEITQQYVTNQLGQLIAILSENSLTNRMFGLTNELTNAIVDQGLFGGEQIAANDGGNQGIVNFVGNIFDRQVNINAPALAAANDLFHIEWTDPMGASYMIDWDPRHHPMIVSLGDFCSKLIGLLAVFLTLHYLVKLTSERMSELARVNASSASGQSLAGFNINWGAATANATGMTIILGAFLLLALGIVVAFGAELAVTGMLGDGAGILTGSDAVMSAQGIQAALVFLDMFVPINALIACLLMYVISTIAIDVAFNTAAASTKFVNA